ncbi:MAG: patatin-like phospholipase family protein [Bacteroidota bacterium]
MKAKEFDKKDITKKAVSRNKTCKATLVLGSGGIRGISQIGIIEVLHEAGIPIGHIVGCSIGAFTGSLYADTCDPKKAYEIALEVIPSGYCYSTFGIPSLRKGLRGKGFFNMKRLEKILSKNLKVKTFEELQMPLSVAATDIIRGRLNRFSKGPLIAPLCASAAIPGVFQPVVIEDSYYVDGAVVSGLPVEMAKKAGADVVIAVNVRPPTSPEEINGKSGFIERSYNIMRDQSEKDEERMADIVLRPRSQEFAFLFASKKKIRNLYEEGKRIAEANLDKIEKLLQSKGS